MDASPYGKYFVLLQLGGPSESRERMRENGQSNAALRAILID
jgi:hypothetical protein